MAPMPAHSRSVLVRALVAPLGFLLAFTVWQLPAHANEVDEHAQSSGVSVDAPTDASPAVPAEVPSPVAPNVETIDETGRGSWRSDSIGWWWLRPDGSFPAARWVAVGTSRYYFNQQGYMVTGWHRENPSWFDFDPSGALRVGWLLEGGRWYYLDPGSGVMVTGLASVGASRYYMDASGAMLTGWQVLGDGWHYFASSGAQVSGWLLDGGEWYYLDPTTGVMRTEPLDLNGHHYEFLPSGAWRGYEAPSGYLQPTARITPLGDATNTLTWGMNGIKVRIVQQRLGLWYSTKLASVDAHFVAAVKNFQQRAGLPVTGVVDRTTWDAMDTGYAWTVDQYQATPVPLTATRGERIEALIGYAWNQIDSSYTWGGAGPYNEGFDCSGLVLQSLYAAGMDPQPIDVIKHGWPSYRTSQELYNYPYFQHVPLAQRQRGDLIFYRSSGVVTHVAIYLGDDLIVHTDWMGRPARVQHITAGYGWSGITPDVVRPLP